MLPALPGPVLLAEIVAPSEIVTEFPAVSVIVPPAPESGDVPVVRLKMPEGVPPDIVADILIVFVALIVMSPPAPLLVVPLLMVPPLSRFNESVMMVILPAVPQVPTHKSLPTVRV